MCKGSYMRNAPKGEWNYQIQEWATSKEIDLKTWIAPVNKKVDLNQDHYFRVRQYNSFCAGLLIALFTQKYDPIQDWATSQDIDWKTWIAPVHKKVDFNPDHYFRWRKYQPYCAGLLGDLFPHKLHPYMLATGNPEFPVRVAALGTKAIHTDKNTPDTPERTVPEIIQMIAEFPSGMVMHISSSTLNQLGQQDDRRG